MPLEIGLWRVDDEPVKVPMASMPLESRLEELIEADPSLLGLPLLLIGRQVPTAYGTFIDLLGIDAEGTLHVLELKRNRTPRDVVAQVLDYGSWVHGLTNEEVRAIYAQYMQARGSDIELDQAFAECFDSGPPDALNTAHTLTVVASDIDAATERIVTYLASEYQVPVNVLFFRYFEDQGHKYLARTWLMDEAITAAAATGPKSQNKKEPWNGQDWYVSFGEEEGIRDWTDARRYGFVSAGGGDWFSRTLRALKPGARVFVHIPKVGYVGVGTVSQEAQPYEDAELVVGGVPQKMADLDLAGRYRHDLPEDEQDRREWVVAVDWQATVPRDQALWKTGMFANQNSACKLRARFTLDEATRYFKIDS
ncbi:endonuclease NucS domain-containing protein [Actinomadura luteofluorescens]|uniref:endonuclease NucS domain-containing protein n=1 Tax=Actinomadura luteofluorescens TaxID=46163 RepID=UPI0030D50E96